MGRVAETANSLAIAVAATAVGCTLVLELAPTHPSGSEQAAAPATSPAVAAGPAAAGRPADARSGPGRPAGPAARAAISALGSGPARAQGSRPGAALPRPGGRTAPGRIRVNGPAGPVSLRANGSFPVAWTNTTGTDVDVWLNAAAGRGRIQRLALVSPRAGAGRAGEAIVTLPAVPPGPAYALEVAAGDGTTHAFSRPFAVTG
ncbi:hypothetical protein ADL22_22250 [Streptomyces sp. NRRL F-4489]|uniref:hypothetical protein n=1 Tax=Streptomyces sp. NRRL F-4489 TaxID=1609095 RepID=UPI000747DDE0|nr:hypothetical protein [Streptomyces sp. NRRL F-4489]KUL37210.1 hypothetical protein ADL22_22250 [Streptomyces sp. NRRL F-4489]